MDAVGPLETRELVYFLTVAEELHFGRAAQKLGIAQPPLSRAIQLLERRLGVALLERTSRKVALTRAGEVLVHEGVQALDQLSAAARRAQRAGRSGPRLVLAMKPGGDAGLLPALLAAYEREPEAVEVEVICSVGERAAMVRDGRADAALMYRPRDDFSGLATEDLAVESQVVVLAKDHRLAEHDSLRMADLQGETTPQWPHLPDQDPSAPLAHDIGQLMQLIALRQLVAVVPASVRAHLRQDLVCVPVTDAEPTTLTLAWPEHSRSRTLAAFVRAATQAAAQTAS
ncbi:LysR family transcriptional regulator [Spirillospora sp. NPDC048911]|uniref:LysR family transcriptional regulator n=1 Tax=Spirillospora sp. NPDC048911 TaxID=3364527 RepID=UPI003724174E